MKKIYTTFESYVSSTDDDNYASYKGFVKTYKERREEFIDSIKSFKDIDEYKIKEIFDFIGTDGYTDEEEALDDFRDKVEEWKKLSDPVRLYRVIGAKSEEDINKEKPGSHWTLYKWNLDGDLLGSIGDDLWEDDMIAYVIEALVPLSSIDYLQTIVQNLNFPNEHEIFLKDSGKNIKIDKIYEL